MLEKVKIRRGILKKKKTPKDLPILSLSGGDIPPEVLAAIQAESLEETGGVYGKKGR